MDNSIPPIIGELHKSWQATSVRYAHWKSIEHLEEGLRGNTDLDILIDPMDLHKAIALIYSVGGVLLQRRHGQGLIGVHDALLMDATTGTLLHLHLHTCLPVGPKGNKDVLLPWVSDILESKEWNEYYCCWTIEPHLELLTLWLRASMKEPLHRVGARYFIRRRVMPASMIEEHRWLMKRMSSETFYKVASRYLSMDREVAARLLSPNPSLRTFHFIRRTVVKAARDWSPARTQPLEGRRGQYAHVKGHGVGQEGLVVALLGPDGSGKSTIVKSLEQWLSWKVAVLRVYMGTGSSGRTSAIRLGEKMVRRTGQALRRIFRRPLIAAPQHGGPGLDRLTSMEAVALAVPIALEKKKRLLELDEIRRSRIIALCDRWPQSSVLGFNDGPLIQHLKKQYPKISGMEFAIYHAFSLNPPDLVLWLDAPPEVLQARKPGNSLVKLQARRSAFAQIAKSINSVVVKVDAMQAIQDVELDCRRAIWEALQNGQRY